MKTTPKDKRLESFVKELCSDETLSWENRFKQIVEWKKGNRGLKGLHMSYLSEDNKTVDGEKVYKGYVLMTLFESQGKFTDVTDGVL